MRKAITVVVLIVVLFVFFAGAWAGYQKLKKAYYIPKVEEINMSEKIDKECFGLFYYEGDRARSVLESDLDIDPNKPIVIYTHGMHHGTGYNLVYNFSDRRIWQNLGYNAFVFRWSQFSDDLNFARIEKKIWTRGNHEFAYKDEYGKRDIAINENSLSLSEIFGAYYNEFMTKYDIKAPEIRFLGHSMGGDLSMGIASYIKTMVGKGALERRFMLTRVVMLDPFLSSVSNPMEAAWLKDSIGQEGNAKLYASVIREYKEIGIPVEYIHSGYADILASKEDRDLMKETAAFIKIDTSFLKGRIDEIIGDAHQVAVDWYSQTMDYTYWDLSAANLNYALASSVPTPYAAGLFGGAFVMNKNTTADVADDEIYSTGFETIQIIGYAFKDKNGNGIMDETFAERQKGINVMLYANDTLVSTKTTNEGGFYKFNLDNSFVGKELKIVVEDIFSSIINSDQSIYESYKNSIGTSGESQEFVPNHKYQIFVKNIGIK
ncbi:MAG: hypothetical protein QM214_04655 [Bacillota bacterium]|jgi:hypothetical protein|nr:hypothetical protein [Bacillota bacterium]HHU43320.1 hypothetical protein [Clostridiales bacterium]